MTGSCARRDHRLQLRRLGCDKEETMSDVQAIADRVEIEALRGEFTDAARMRDGDRLASLLTHDACCGCQHPRRVQRTEGDPRQINLIRAAADPRSRRSLGEQI
jgi:hypothetical protein